MNSINRTRARSLAVILATLGVLASVGYGAETPLSNGVPVTGISGAAGSEKFYKIEVPAGQDELEISTSGGTGDVDLYVRRGSLPTTTSYDYRPYKVGNDETVTVDHPAAGTWYVMLRGYIAYSGVTLQATYSAAMTVTPLANSVPVPNLSGTAGGEQYFSIEVPAGQTKLEISMSGGTGDADLYVKKDSLPTTTSYDYRPFLFGNNETVSVNNPAAGTWYIMMRGYDAYAGITLLASYSGGGVGSVLQNGVPVTSLSGTPGGEQVFRIDVPAGQTNLEIVMWGGTGDADLYVRYGSRPTITAYDYRPFLPGNDETVTINDPTAGTWYILVRGYSNYSGVSLKATYGDIFTLQDGVAVPGLSGALGSEKFYKIEVPSGQNDLVFSISGGAGNADLYVRRGSKPTTSTWDYRPYLSGNTESVSISNPPSGTWYVMLKARAAYSMVTLEAEYSYTEAVTLLDDGVPITNISGAAGSEKFYRLVVPSGQQKLTFKISGGTGDADLYVKRGSKPTTTEYDYRPYLAGSNETVTINNPTGGDWFVMIRGYQAYSGLTLVADFETSAPPEEVITLTNGVPVSGVAGATGSEKFYKINVPAGQAKLEIMTSGGTGDLDLYVRKDSKPTTTQWDYRPYLMGNNETVTIDTPAAGTYYIMLRAYAAYDGVTLKATYTPVVDEIMALVNGVPRTGLSGATGSEKFFMIAVPAGQDLLTIETSGGTGDVDLHVKKGSRPTTTSYDYRPYLIGNNEKVEVPNPAAASWFGMLHAYQAYSGLTLVATYGAQGNKFTTDPNCVALWRFESDKLGLDSIGANHLSNKGATASTVNFKEGSSAADFEVDDTDYMSIVDADLSSVYPHKNGTTNRKMSLCFWVKFESFPPNTGHNWLYKKGGDTDKLSFLVHAYNSIGVTRLNLAIGTNGGNDYYTVYHPSSLQTGVWYHVGITYDDVTQWYRIRIWDDTAKAILGTDYVGSMLMSMAFTDAPVVIGDSTDALLDEMVVFKDVLTVDEIDKIRAGTYGK